MGEVVISFHLHSDGRVSDLKVTENSVGVLFHSLQLCHFGFCSVQKMAFRFSFGFWQRFSRSLFFFIFFLPLVFAQ